MADVYIVSSSPPPRYLTTFDMSSSPPLPSLNEVLKKKAPPLRTGIRAVPNPQNASATFASASAVFKKTSSKDLELEDIRAFTLDKQDDGALLDPASKSAKAKRRKASAKNIENGGGKIAKPRKTATKKDAAIDGDKEPKKPRKARAKKLDIVDEEGGAVKEPVTRKPRAKKSDKETAGDDTTKEKPVRKTKVKKTESESQTKLPKGKVTKTSTGPKSKGASRLDSAQLLDTFADSLDYGLVEAVSRRTAWTPPPPTGVTETMSSAASVVSGDKGQGFTDLLGSYGFTKAESSITNKAALAGEASRKRKLIELIKTSVATAAAASPREKAPKKKPRTLTDQATSAYAEEEDSELLANPAPLLQYFSLQTTERTTSDGFKIPPKPRSKSPVKGGSKAKKGTAQAPILLSPESALKQVGNQDFVFGTSSQLAREDSPTLLRDLHEAMQASNEAGDDDPFEDSLLESASHTLAGRGKASLSTKRNLWSAASRDIGGNLEDVEIIDLADSSPMATKKVPTTAVFYIPSSIPDEDDEDFWHDVEELSQSLTENSRHIEVLRDSAPVGKPEMLPTPPWTWLPEALSPKAAKISTSTAPSKASPSIAKSAKTVSKPLGPVMPDFSAYTTLQLAKEVASYRFKPIKSRNQMISLLEKCWQGKNRTALGMMGTNTVPATRVPTSEPAAPVPGQPEASPKRPRGRPRKDSTATSPSKSKIKSSPKKTTNTVEYLEMDSDTPLSQIRTPRKSQKKAKQPAEDIFDSDAAITSSPPRRRGSQSKTRPLPLKLSRSVSDPGLELSPKSPQNLLFQHISSAVTSAPRSKDSTNPSWHEKILLYDPIILEDLAVWLNTGALERVGWDGEVDPKEVKRWCESKSICCLWKENLRGGSRSHY